MFTLPSQSSNNFIVCLSLAPSFRLFYFYHVIPNVSVNLFPAQENFLDFTIIAQPPPATPSSQNGHLLVRDWPRGRPWRHRRSPDPGSTPPAASTLKVPFSIPGSLDRQRATNDTGYKSGSWL